MLEIYTDGGCIQNPGGIGSWAFIAVDDGQEIHREWGTDPETTNNRMELTAVIRAMRWAEGKACTIKTDSDLTVKCGNRVWKRRANLDLWEEFDEVRALLDAKLGWVRGHSKNRWNCAADEICTQAMLDLQKEPA
jgi:ribonuclease HI